MGAYITYYKNEVCCRGINELWCNVLAGTGTDQ